MFTRRCSIILGRGRDITCPYRGRHEAAQAPKISKPRPAPLAASAMPPLPPAAINDALAIVR